MVICSWSKVGGCRRMHIWLATTMTAADDARQATAMGRGSDGRWAVFRLQKHQIVKCSGTWSADLTWRIPRRKASNPKHRPRRYVFDSSATGYHQSAANYCTMPSDTSWCTGANRVLHFWGWVLCNLMR